MTATKTAGYVYLLPDDGPSVDVSDLVMQSMAIVFRPWLRPDRNPMPMFDLFPRLSRFKRAWDRHWSEGEPCECEEEW
jgi:hypothetical protein